MERTEYGYRLSSGKQLFTHILGLTTGVGERMLFTGYDCEVEDASDYTPSERDEIARFMIDVWKAWADDLN